MENFRIAVMNHSDHVRLIKKGVGNEKIWADFGSGEGAFTLALRDIGGEDIEIYSIDKDLTSLQTQRKRFLDMFSSSRISFIQKDFTEDLDLPLLDGILMANSLHFISDQENFLRNIKKILKPNGKVLLVEYNSDTGNQWVPYPVSFTTFTTLAEKTGYEKPQFLEKVPSQFLHEVYATVTTSISL